KSEVYLYEDNKESMKAEIPQGNGYYNEIQYFAQCVKNHEQPISALPQKTVEVLKVIEAVKESLETGKIIEL
ncbi:MAG: hypothetical protein RR625_06070, partial [Christensenellaceae bacterium]